MYLIQQDIANEIAKGPMKYWLMKILFESSEEEAEKIESLIWNETEIQYSDNVGRAISISLPLLLEHNAITKYINKTKRYELRMALPEILSPYEGAYLAKGDIMYMSKDEITQTIEALSYYQKTLSQIKTKKSLQLSIPFAVEKQLLQEITNARARRVLGEKRSK